MKRKITKVKKIKNDIDLLLNQITSDVVQVVVILKLKEITPETTITLAQKILEATREESQEEEKNLDIYPAMGYMSIEASTNFIKTLIQQKGIKKVEIGKGIAELHDAQMENVK